MASIDSLNIQITANATSASRAIDNLVEKLDGLSTSLNRINGSSLNGLANGVQRLGTAMQTMNSVRASDFTRLARNLTALGNVNTASLNSAASSMTHLTRAFNNLGGVSANATQVGELARNISRLGGANVQRAITNLPQLATALNNLMATLSRTPRVSQNLIQMTNALANLASQGNRVGSASNMLVNGLNRTHAAARRTSKSVTSLAAAFGKFYANFFLLVRGIKALGRSIESTGDYTEAFNYYTVTFGKIASKWDENWANYGDENARNYGNAFVTEMNDTFKKLSGVSYDPKTGLLSETGLKNLGLNIKDVTEYAAQLASMMDAVGHSGEVTLATTKAFTKLAADISSLTNRDYTEVGGKIRSVLQGQSRAGYGFGWDTTMASLQAMADKLDLSKAVSEMTQMEKQQLRILTILDQSTVAWRDQSNTINTFANQVRLLKNNFSEAGMMLGQLFIPLLAKILPFLNGLLIALKRLFGFLASFLNLDLGDTGQGFLDLEEDIDGVGDSLDDATDSAKKFKKQLAGFDELENLSSETGKSKLGVGGTGIDLTSEILKATEAYEKAFDEAFERMENKAQDWADRIVEFFTTGNVSAKISKALTDALNGIDWDSIYAFARDFGTGLADSLNSFITPDLFGKVGQTISGLLNASIYQALSIAKNFNWENFGNSLATGINEFFKKFDAKSLAETINTWIKGALEAVTTLLKKTDFELIGNKIGEFLSELDFGEILGDIASLIWETLKGGFNAVAGIFEEAPLETALITAFAVLKFTNLGAFVSTKIATALAAKLGLAGTFTSVGSVFVTALGKALTTALTAVGGIGGLLTLDMTALVGTTGAASLGLLVGAGVIGGVIAALSGWHFGQFLYEKFTGEAIEMSWEEQFHEIFKSFEDGTWTDALTLWGEDVYDAFVQIGEDQQKWAKDTYDKIAGFISDWWERRVAPYFTKEKWLGLWYKVKDSAVEMWDNFVEWWQNTALAKWWDDNVAPWFTLDKWSEVTSGISDGISETWDNTVTEWVEDITDWWNNDVKPWFTKEKWMDIISNIPSAFLETFNNIKDTVGGIIQDLIDTINKFFDDIMSKTSGLTGGLGDALGGLVNKTTKSTTIPQFATGGFPQQYSLFMAGENGIPELAGTVGGKTAVAGGAEITGIRQEIRATANEEMALLRQQNSLLQAILEKEFGISQDALFSSVRNSANDYHRRTGNFAFDI